MKTVMALVGLLVLLPGALMAGSWEWQSPYPTGEFINDLHFASANEGWFAGGNGTVFHTTDGGVSWERQSTGTHGEFLDLCVVGTEQLWAVGFAEYGAVQATVVHSPDGGASWQSQNGRFVSCVGGLDFVDPLEGWSFGTTTCGAPTVYGLAHTTNGGAEWTTLIADMGISIDDIRFVSAQIGWVSGQAQDYLQSATILKTTDGGLSWQSQLTTGDQAVFQRLCFLDSLNGWAVGGDFDGQFFGTYTTLVYETHDGGQNWLRMPNTAWNFCAVDVDFVDLIHGWIPAASGKILRTTDGGLSWDSSHVAVSQGILCMAAVDPDHVWASGAFSEILRSGNGGQTWEHLDHGAHESFRAVSFASPAVGVAVGDMSTISTTTDGGESWVSRTVPRLEYFIAVQMVSEQVGWMLGMGGGIWRTTDGGVTWDSTGVAAGVDMTDLEFAGEQWGWAIGYIYNESTQTLTDYCYRTVDGGAHWTRELPPLGFYPLAVDFVDSARGWIVGNNGQITHTVDGGVTWEAQTSGTLSDLQQLCMIDSAYGWAGGNDGSDASLRALLHTTDGGSTWWPVTPDLWLDVSWLECVAFTDRRHGWLSGSGLHGLMTSVWATTDGGSHWNAELVGVTPLLSDLEFLNDSTGWVVGGGGLIGRYIPAVPEAVPGTGMPVAVPERMTLAAYPNPFNSSTMLVLDVPAGVREVTLTAYNVLGQQVRTERMPVTGGPLRYAFDGRDLSAGLYWIRAAAGEHNAVHKLILLK